MSGTITYPVFDGQIVFHMRLPTLRRTRNVIKISEAFERAGLLPKVEGSYPSDKAHESTLVMLLSFTEKIEFDLDDKSHTALHAFKAFNKQMKALNLDDDASVNALWEARLDQHNQIIDAWIAAVDAAQNENIINNVESLPAEALNGDDKEELANPESPLAESGVNSRND